MRNDKATACCSGRPATDDKLLPVDPEAIVGSVREHYARIAESDETKGCCGTTSLSTSRTMGYREGDLAAIPDGADMGLGCGAPVEHLELQPGETVLDLGSGGGIDVFLAARQVGPAGRAIGVDMTPEMIAKAEAGAARAGIDNVEFRHGRLEALPLEDESVDAVTSNCVINLVPDKAAVFREIARVLKPGGRVVISDILLDRPLPEAVERNVLAHAGCVSGAMLRDDYFGILREAGLGEVEILRDSDYLTRIAAIQPAEARQLEDEIGIRISDLERTVASVTFRAVKPS